MISPKRRPKLYQLFSSIRDPSLTLPNYGTDSRHLVLADHLKLKGRSPDTLYKSCCRGLISMHYSVCKPRIRLQPVVIPTVDFCFPLPEQPKIEKVERAVIEIDNSPNPQTTSTTTEVPPSILKNQLKMVQAQRTESQPVTSQIASKLASSQPTPTSTVTSKPSVTSATPQLAGILDEPVSISTAINTSQGMSINPSGFSIIYGSARDFYCKSIRFQFSIHLTLAIVLNKTLKLKTRLRAIFFSHCLFMVRL